jgi:hypothetical protein
LSVPVVVARHVARARRAQAGSEPARERDLGPTADRRDDSMSEILDARCRDPRTSARDLASLVNARARLDAEQRPEAERARETQLLAATRRIRELEAAVVGLPRFMPGVEEWFAALPADVEDWAQLPDAPVELIDTYGEAHTVVAEDVWFFVEHLGWTTPPRYEPDEELIEEWRLIIADHDARKAQGHPRLDD